ncbi:MAG: 4-alpha-glucanotransferase [Gammaproteobacteria bacterium]|nr:4-alpha-glucanotransferase [Gammaproteobacteria bacterium]MBU1489554.1 4-alpha-glucanotransferase [Gammaproteobacteria bacterium]MBU2067827.1 4-alpha-glucanotransferase [Gammaproteobacteria bacterium]MBU2141010.1 4-alpha-glucanotransferase [Gammaproteobacteria bacterium]MBU2217359.1 4-alpha-glucanotransferase [Gammaproteobacteria bacterium]
MSDALYRLAQEAGLSLDWVDADGNPQRLQEVTLRPLLGALGHPADSDDLAAESLAILLAQRREAGMPPLLTVDQGQPLDLSRWLAPDSAFTLTYENGETHNGTLSPLAQLPACHSCGYQRLEIADQVVTLAVAPPACPSVAELCAPTRRLAWGLSAQLYGLRRPGDGGLGDTAALAELVRSAASKGADALAISPTHAMYGSDNQIFSPYSPSSRLFSNVLYAAPAQVLGQAAVDAALVRAGLEDEWQRLSDLDLVDWRGVSAARQALLRQLHLDFAQVAAPLRDDFAAFCAEGGEALLLHCRFETLRTALLSQGLPGDWQAWPTLYQAPDHAALAQLLAPLSEQVELQAFGQWLMARCMDQVQATARQAGMHIGLIADLAVGADPAGSQAWSRQEEFLSGVTVGAPPDILNRSGQSWGVSAFSPEGLVRHGYRAFIEMLRANMAHAGGIRIDHIMGLQRLWVIPRGAGSQDGGYLNYPLDDLLRLVSLEASRHNALVIGEDLGTVPEGLRQRLAQRGILGMRVLLFEQQHGHFIAPADWPRDALATTTTHDLPSISGWYTGEDIHWRERAGHRDAEHTAGDLSLRRREAHALREALEAHSGRALDEPEALLDAAMGYVGQTPAPLVLLPLEDAMASDQQPNLPGPGDLHPNWRRRWAVDAGAMLDIPRINHRLYGLAQARRSAQDSSHD